MKLTPPSTLPVIRCYFNERCLDSPFVSPQAAQEGLEAFLEVYGKLVKRAWRETTPKCKPLVELFNLSLLQSCGLTQQGLTFRGLQKGMEKESGQRLLKLIVDSKWGEPLGPVKHLDKTDALGLTCAHEQGAFAVSLLTHECWSKASLSLDCGTTVDHLASSVSLDQAAAWFAKHLGDFDDFLRLVQPDEASYKQASEYKKHVMGKTNEERARNARQGDGQYFAFLRGNHFSDEKISGLEREAIYRLREGSSYARLERHSASTFYIYYEAQENIGYLGDSGVESRQIRVDWCNGEVHSHPRKWS